VRNFPSSRTTAHLGGSSAFSTTGAFDLVTRVASSGLAERIRLDPLPPRGENGEIGWRVAWVLRKEVLARDLFARVAELEQSGGVTASLGGDRVIAFHAGESDRSELRAPAALAAPGGTLRLRSSDSRKAEATLERFGTALSRTGDLRPCRFERIVRARSESSRHRRGTWLAGLGST
jgi:hypothetical protein